MRSKKDETKNEIKMKKIAIKLFFFEDDYKKGAVCPTYVFGQD